MTPRRLFLAGRTRAEAAAKFHEWLQTLYEDAMRKLETDLVADLDDVESIDVVLDAATDRQAAVIGGTVAAFEAAVARQDSVG